MDTFKYTASDNTQVHCYRWKTESEPQALVHIAHGMGEHAGRYDRFASMLVTAGYEVTANDHRGHGLTADKLGDFGEDGWNRTISDLHGILQSIKSENPDKQLVLFGHSMGAMLSQQYAARHGKTLDALILSGSPGAGKAFQMWFAHLLARFERWRVGGRGESSILKALLFDSSNKDFEDEPDATGYEWLSRDKDQVRIYIEDAMCGFVPCPMSVCDLFKEERANWKSESIENIPANLPVYLFSGSADPVHNGMKNINRLLKLYRNRGLKITTKFYAEGRHEMLNETNKESVIREVISWIDAHI